MTQEEKAKAYDEALKYAKIYYTNGDEDMKMMMKTCFPVLVEDSEDEMIRKALLEMVHDTTGDELWVDYNVHKEDALAWLEKQGKNNMGISETTKRKLEDNLNKALEKETPESWNKFLDEQCEQKMKTPEESLCIDSDTYNKIVDECVYGEQKPIKEHNACEFCEDRYGCVSPCSMKLIEEEKPAPQTTWKPSGEQMLAINTAINVLGKGTINGKYLIELQEQLMKLMEE